MMSAFASRFPSLISIAYPFSTEIILSFSILHYCVCPPKWSQEITRISVALFWLIMSKAYPDLLTSVLYLHVHNWRSPPLFWVVVTREPHLFPSISSTNPLGLLSITNHWLLGLSKIPTYPANEIGLKVECCNTFLTYYHNNNSTKLLFKF